MARLTMKHMKNTVKAKDPSHGNLDNIWSPMGNLNTGDNAIVRLIPYEDELSGGFWTTQKLIGLEFVNPDDETKPLKYTIPCLEMYMADVKCPIAEQSRKLFKEAKSLADSGLSDEAKNIETVALQHWIRYSYYFQGFILSGGIKQPDANTLVPIKFPKSIFTSINASVTDASAGFDTLPTGEFELEDIKKLAAGEVPEGVTEDDFLSWFVGRNYVTRKTKKDKFNNYDTSSWEMKENMLTDEQIDYIADAGLLDMSSFLPKQPTTEQYEVFAEMAAVSIEYALGEGTGEWNPVWTDEYGIKPHKQHDEEDSTHTTSTSKTSLKERMAAKLAEKAGDAASLHNSRGVNKTEEVKDVKEETPVTEEASTSSRVAAMKKRLAAKKEQQNA